MSGPYTSYNTVPPNFEFQVEKYANPYGKIAGVGCDGTKSGVDATLPKYSSPFVGGNSGYSFTDNPIAPVAGPGAPYSEIRSYNDRGNYRDLFPKLFKGGKTRRVKHKKHTQYGCSRKTHGGKKSSMRKRRTTKHIKKRKSKRTHKRYSKKSYAIKRRRTMRGGMTSASDYTEGRDTSQDQPYGNKAISFGQGLDSMLSANESALASPPPFLPYNNCGKVMRY